jgi:hypothetical protein
MDRADTYDHRSVRTGHPVRNHDVSIVFVVPGTKILEKKVLFLDSGLTDYADSVAKLRLQLEIANLNFSIVMAFSLLLAHLSLCCEAAGRLLVDLLLFQRCS